MARTRTRANLVADVRKRADAEGATGPLPTSEVEEYVNQAIAAYHDIVVRARGDSYFPQAATANTAANTSVYAITAFTNTTSNASVTDFYKVLALRANVNGSFQQLRPYNRNERAALLDPNIGWDGQPLFYGVELDSLQVLPVPAGVHTMTLEYIPAATRLANDNSTFDGVNGWEIFVVDWAALRCASKLRRDMTLIGELQASVAEQGARIADMAADRVDQPARITDVRPRRRRWA